MLCRFMKFILRNSTLKIVFLNLFCTVPMMFTITVEKRFLILDPLKAHIFLQVTALEVFELNVGNSFNLWGSPLFLPVI